MYSMIATSVPGRSTPGGPRTAPASDSTRRSQQPKPYTANHNMPPPDATQCLGIEPHISNNDPPSLLRVSAAKALTLRHRNAPPVDEKEIIRVRTVEVEVQAPGSDGGASASTAVPSSVPSSVAATMPTPLPSSSYTPSSISLHPSKPLYQSPRLNVPPATPFFPTTPTHSDGCPSSRWSAQSEFAGPHRQDQTLLDLSHRQSLTTAALEYGVPPRTAAMVQELRYGEVGRHGLPKLLDVVALKFPRLKRFSLVQEVSNSLQTGSTKGQNEKGPFSPTRPKDPFSDFLPAVDDEPEDEKVILARTEPNDSLFTAEENAVRQAQSQAERERVRMQRLYILYRLPDLEEINGEPVAEEERRIARPGCPSGCRVRKEEWATRSMAAPLAESGSDAGEEDDDEEISDDWSIVRKRGDRDADEVEVDLTDLLGGGVRGTEKEEGTAESDVPANSEDGIDENGIEFSVSQQGPSGVEEQTKIQKGTVESDVLAVSEDAIDESGIEFSASQHAQHGLSGSVGAAESILVILEDCIEETGIEFSPSKSPVPAVPDSIDETGIEFSPSQHAQHGLSGVSGQTEIEEGTAENDPTVSDDGTDESGMEFSAPQHAQHSLRVGRTKLEDEEGASESDVPPVSDFGINESGIEFSASQHAQHGLSGVVGPTTIEEGASESDVPTVSDGIEHGLSGVVGRTKSEEGAAEIHVPTVSEDSIDESGIEFSASQHAQHSLRVVVGRTKSEDEEYAAIRDLPAVSEDDTDEAGIEYSASQHAQNGLSGVVERTKIEEGAAESDVLAVSENGMDEIGIEFSVSQHAHHGPAIELHETHPVTSSSDGQQGDCHQNTSLTTELGIECSASDHFGSHNRPTDTVIHSRSCPDPEERPSSPPHQGRGSPTPDSRQGAFTPPKVVACEDDADDILSGESNDNELSPCQRCSSASASSLSHNQMESPCLPNKHVSGPPPSKKPTEPRGGLGRRSIFPMQFRDSDGPVTLNRSGGESITSKGETKSASIQVGETTKEKLRVESSSDIVISHDVTDTTGDMCTGAITETALTCDNDEIRGDDEHHADDWTDGGSSGSGAHYPPPVLERLFGPHSASFESAVFKESTIHVRAPEPPKGTAIALASQGNSTNSRPGAPSKLLTTLPRNASSRPPPSPASLARRIPSQPHQLSKRSGKKRSRWSGGSRRRRSAARVLSSVSIIDGEEDEEDKGEAKEVDDGDLF